MTKKFMCVTQDAHLAVYPAPSSMSYQSIRGSSFSVENKLDIEYFSKKKQFVEVGLFKKKTDIKPVSDPADVLRLNLSLLKVSNKTVETISAQFFDEEHLKESILTGDDLTAYVSKSDAKKITQHYAPEVEE